MKIEKILLLTPPATTFRDFRDINPLPPMGLGYLAGVAERLGIEVKIIDCMVEGWEIETPIDEELVRVGLPYETIKKKIVDFDPDVVGVNCQFSRQYRIYNDVLALAKEAKPGCITMAGGAHSTVCTRDVIGNPACDFIVMGEAEVTFDELIRALNDGSDYRGIEGLGWKENGEIVLNPRKHWIEDLDSLPFPAYHLMNLEKYFGLTASHGLRHKKRFMPIITSRGCPAKCSFCTAKQVWGNKYRTRSVENVIEEMRLLRNEYGVEELMFEDDNVTANPVRAKKLFTRMIEEEFGFIWDTPNGVGVWSIDNECLDLMKKAGCININFPVESGSQRVLTDIIRKPLNLEKVRKLIEHCQEIELAYNMFLVVGMPGETVEEMWQSIKFAAKCGVYRPHISVATPYPGSDLFEICKERNLFTRPYTLDDLFIRAFLIETPEWNEQHLRKLYRDARVYLTFREIMDHPAHLLKYASKAIKAPKRILSFLSRDGF